MNIPPNVIKFTSSTFPQLPLETISRDNYITAIDDSFGDDCGVVSVDAPLGMGKTVILANYAIAKSPDCLSLFARPTSRMTYDPQLLFFDLCNQMNYLWLGSEIQSDADIDETLYRAMLYKLQRRAMRQNNYIYFVVDGLDDIPAGAEYAREYLFGLLPFGLQAFRIVLTNLFTYADKFKNTCNYKTLQITPLSNQESSPYFNGIALDDTDLREILRCCKGNPSSLASIKRLLITNGDNIEVVKYIPDTLNGLYEKEWQNVDQNNSSLINILACLAHIRTNHTINLLEKIFSINGVTIQDLLSKLTFVEINSASLTVFFVSESFRQFVVKKLSNLRANANDIIIDFLLQNPASPDALKDLPGFLKDTNKTHDILTFLSPENLEKMIDIQQSYIPIQHQADIGIEAALKLNQDQDLIKLSAYKSALLEFCQSSVWQSQVHSRVALGDFEGAMLLSQQVCMKEDRLQLLATVARCLRSSEKVIDPAIIDQIKTLYSQIDISKLGDRTIEIACDLLYTLPELAIELVENSPRVDSGENSIDWAFARLSIEAALVRKINDKTTPNPLELISAKLKDTKIRRFTDAASIMFGDYTASHVINEVEKIKDTSSKLFLIRQWIQANYSRADSIDVVEFALKLTIRITEYAPNAQVFREIASPLPYSKDITRVEAIIRNIDGQKANIANIGPTQEFIWLELIIAKAESKYDFDRSIERLIEIYLTIIDLADLSLKGDCLSNFIAYLEQIDPERKSNNKHSLYDLAEQDFDTYTNELLMNTGEHFEVFRRSIIFLSSTPHLSRVIHLASQLNIESRRDNALLDIVKTATTFPIDEWNFKDLLKCIELIKDRDIRDEGLLPMIEQIVQQKQISEIIIQELIRMKDRFINMADGIAACRGMCLLYNVISTQTNNEREPILKQILAELHTRLNKIDIAWVRIDVGFRISATIANSNREFAHEIAETTENLQKETPLNNAPTAQIYIYCVNLALRAFGGLLKKEVDTKEDISDIEQIINAIPSYGERAKLWSELAQRFWLAGRISECIKITNTYIRPAYSNLSPCDAWYKTAVLTRIAPALYLTDSANTLHLLSLIPRQDRDICLNNIATFILRHQITTDPFDESANDSSNGVTFEEIEKLIAIIRILETDAIIYALISTIIDCIVAEGRARFSIQQKAEIRRQLKEIVPVKFPHQDFIKHNGFLIAANAQIGRLQKESTAYWDNLVEQANKIPNKADKAFVLIKIAFCIEKKFNKKRDELITLGKSIVDTIPSHFDRIEHLEVLGKEVYSFDIPRSREFIREAMKNAISYEGGEIVRVQRRLVDFAYRLDPDFASSLASLADDDPSKKDSAKAIKDRIKLHKNKVALADQRSDLEIGVDEEANLSRTAWMYLGAMNAGRLEPLRFDTRTRAMIQIASRKPMSHAYPIFSCILEGLSRRYSCTHEATSIMRPIYSTFLLNAHLCSRIANKQLRNSSLEFYKMNSIKEQSTIIMPGQKDAGMYALEEKLSEIISDHLVIADPYFGPEDLTILKIVNRLNPKCNVTILTSRKHLEDNNVPTPWGDSFLQFWHKISDMEPPVNRIIVIAIEPGNGSPIHDRWIVTSQGGIRIGTSINGLGVSRVSEFSVLTKEEAHERELHISKFTVQRERVFNGQKVRYNEFSI